MTENQLTISKLEIASYNSLIGYDENFLGQRIPLPVPSNESDMLLQENGDPELRYTHFSIIMSRERCLPYITAVNIDGNKSRKVKRRDVWYYDPRIPQTQQYGPELYADNDLDRGHLVRRLDPVWGKAETAKRAAEDSFHFTNCAPQHEDLNRREWLGLEDYILENAVNHELKITVFTGPVFRSTDKLYRGKYLIPQDYWKLVAFNKDSGELSATAYQRTQRQLIEDLLTGFTYGRYKTYQVPIPHITELTGINFDQFTHPGLLTTRQGIRLITDLHQITL